MNKVLKGISVLLIIAAIVFVGYKLVNKDQKEQSEEIKSDKATKASQVDQNASGAASSAQGNGKEDVALPVKAIVVKRGNLPLRLNISATADVWEKTTVRSEIGGIVSVVNAAIGKSFGKDQLLVKLDDTETKLRVDLSEAEKLKARSRYLVSESTVKENSQLSAAQQEEMKSLQAQYEKALKEYESGKITSRAFEAIDDKYQAFLIESGYVRNDVRKAQEGLSSATIQLKQMQLELARTSIKSPFPAVVSDLKISKGERISAGQELLKVVNLNSVYLKGFALESEIANLKIGTKVRVKFDAYPERYFYGEIQQINPEIDPVKKTITVYVRIDNKEKKIFPGMHAEIDVEYKVFENVLKVPRNAVIFRQDRYLVFVVRDINGNSGIANWEYVTLGNQNDDEIEIFGEIKEGDLVLVEGHQTLAHQSKVKIIQDEQ